MKKKVLFLSPLPPPHYGSAMSSLMCLNLLKKSERFDIHNIKLNYSKEMDDIGKVSFLKIQGIWAVKNEIKRYFKHNKPDIVYFVPATYSLGLIRDWLFVREIKKYWSGKIIFHIRSRILEKTWNSFLGRKVLKNMYVDNKAIVLGKELTKDLRGMIPDKNIFILPNAIENEVSDSSVKKIIKKRRQNLKFKILFLSNMDRTKGWSKVLDACRILKEKNFDFRCDFVGKWLNKKDEKYFWDFIKKNELSNEVFSQGEKRGKEKNVFLKNANVLVFPTERDTFGKVLIEAYMFGVPTIANREGSIPSIIDDGKTGFLLNENTGEVISEKILGNKDWEKMGLLGRIKFLKNFEINVYEKKLLEIFK